MNSDKQIVLGNNKILSSHDIVRFSNLNSRHDYYLLCLVTNAGAQAKDLRYGLFLQLDGTHSKIIRPFKISGEDIISIRKPSKVELTWYRLQYNVDEEIPFTSAFKYIEEQNPIFLLPQTQTKNKP